MNRHTSRLPLQVTGNYVDNGMSLTHLMNRSYAKKWHGRLGVLYKRGETTRFNYKLIVKKEGTS
jgi:hypothetical protein